MPAEISTDDIKNVLAGEKGEETQVIQYIKAGKAIPLEELVFQKESTFNKNLQTGIKLEFMNFKMDPKRTTKRIISTVNIGVAMYPKFVKTNRGVPSIV